jgi:hypothetical protein
MTVISQPKATYARSDDVSTAHRPEGVSDTDRPFVVDR